MFVVIKIDHKTSIEIKPLKQKGYWYYLLSLYSPPLRLSLFISAIQTKRHKAIQKFITKLIPYLNSYGYDVPQRQIDV